MKRFISMFLVLSIVSSVFAISYATEDSESMPVLEVQQQWEEYNRIFLEREAEFLQRIEVNGIYGSNGSAKFPMPSVSLPFTPDLQIPDNAPLLVLPTAESDIIHGKVTGRDYENYYLDTDGKVYGWGQASYDSYTEYVGPREAVGLPVINNIASGYAVGANGNVYSLSWDSYSKSVTYSQVIGLSNIKKVATYGYRSFYEDLLTLDNAGNVHHSSYGDITIDEDEENNDIYVVDIAMDWDYCYVLLSNGNLYGYGMNIYHTGTAELLQTNVVQIAACEYNAIILKNDGSVWERSYDDPFYPKSISPGIEVAKVFAGIYYNQYTDTNGTLYGGMYHDTVSNVVSVFAGFRHEIALKDNKTLWGIGDNQGYILGLPSYFDDYSTNYWEPISLFSPSITGFNNIYDETVQAPVTSDDLYLPYDVDTTFSDGRRFLLQVNWDKSKFNPNLINVSQAITGELVLQPGVINPDNLKVNINVTVTVVMNPELLPRAFSLYASDPQGIADPATGVIGKNGAVIGVHQGLIGGTMLNGYDGTAAIDVNTQNALTASGIGSCWGANAVKFANGINNSVTYTPTAGVLTGYNTTLVYNAVVSNIGWNTDVTAEVSYGEGLTETVQVVAQYEYTEDNYKGQIIPKTIGTYPNVTGVRIFSSKGRGEMIVGSVTFTSISPLPDVTTPPVKTAFSLYSSDPKGVVDPTTGVIGKNGAVTGVHQGLAGGGILNGTSGTAFVDVFTPSSLSASGIGSCWGACAVKFSNGLDNSVTYTPAVGTLADKTTLVYNAVVSNVDWNAEVTAQVSYGNGETDTVVLVQPFEFTNAKGNYNGQIIPRTIGTYPNVKSVKIVSSNGGEVIVGSVTFMPENTNTDNIFISDWEFKSGLNGTPITNLRQGFVQGNFIIVNQGNNSQKIVAAVILVKKSDGKYHDIAMVEKVIGANSSVPLTAGFNVPENSQEHKIIAVVWDSAETMNPISNEVIFE